MNRAVVTLIAALCCTLMAWSQGEVHWLETTHDFGTINETDGKVSCTMRMVNTGDEALVITRVQPTCGCTASDYTHEAIAPGDTAKVTLIYNPANRPGEFDKDVFVYTNGTPRRSRVTITGKVVGAPETVNHRYPVAVGGLRLEVANVPLGELNRGQSRNAYINAYNGSPDTLVVTVSGNKPHVSLNAAPDTVAPGSASAIIAHYDTRQAPLWGLNVDTLMVMSEPLHNSPTAIAGITRVYVMAQVMEDMTKLTPEQRERAPKLKLDTEKIIFENMHLDELGYGVITLHNTGKDVLAVRRLWCPDKAVTIDLVPSVIKKGKKAAATVEVHPALVDGGVLNTTLTIITNDPDNPVQQVRLVGYVSKQPVQ